MLLRSGGTSLYHIVQIHMHQHRPIGYHWSHTSTSSRSNGEERLVVRLLLLADLTKRIVSPESGLLQSQAVRIVKAGANGNT